MKTALVLRSVAKKAPVLCFQLELGTFVLGRSSGVDFVVPHTSISRRHAEITIARQLVTVRDLGSLNGTHMNGAPVNQAAVQIGQQVTFGEVSFALTLLPQIGAEDVPTDKVVHPAIKQKRAELSASQRRVLDLVLAGLSDKEISIQLKVGTSTVNKHVQAIYQKFDVPSRPRLLALLLGSMCVA